MPALKLAQAGKATIIPKLSGSEDFSGFPKGAPGFFFFFLGAPSSHSPLFYIDEDQQPVGARTLAALAVDFLQRT